MAHHTSTNSGTVATNMDRFNNFQRARPVGSSVWVLNQPYIILYKWKLVFTDLCPNYCCLYRLLGMELSARDNGSATTALQCRWHDSTSGAPDISQGGQLCMGDSHAWNTGIGSSGCLAPNAIIWTKDGLTHCNICVGNQTIIGSDNGLSPGLGATNAILG